MQYDSVIYQTAGYPVGELVKLAELRARDSRVPTVVVLLDGSEIVVPVPEGRP